ncbi:hypothetical protein N3K66_006944 [Trichothecium roseum]|uniref:Uncharacterized protein n=1 Tax=Trichothecium roseum TaxID=47278 RepID=A0ACC0UX83_9HYPO|nr:hypothetical protein N3K66_006944 [Trichothecium roseum]
MTAGLPPGWEWDYDGRRWFYTYKPTGHVQYHFPTEGDEFPSFVDEGSPVPKLAPEERLESQQQLKRNAPDPDKAGGGSGGGSGGGGGNLREPAWKSGMSATSARPVSNIWEHDDDGGEQPFQPESFMFLGPGAYNDVSPLHDEDDEAAKRVVVSGTKGVSPDGSRGGTPHMANIEGVVNTPSSPLGTKEEDGPAMLDSREMPHELPAQDDYWHRRRDPVGVVAEMATEQTAASRAETHPDPVELGDNSILAPADTAPVELAAESIPVSPPPPAAASDAAGSHPDADEVEKKEDTGSKITNKPTNLEEVYQPYKPSEAVEMRSSPETAEVQKAHTTTEVVLTVDATASDGQAWEQQTTSQYPDCQSKQPIIVNAEGVSPVPGLASMPSVLKPAQQRKPVPSAQNDQAGQPGVAKFPSVLKPGRARAASQPSQVQESGQQPLLEAQVPASATAAQPKVNNLAGQPREERQGSVVAEGIMPAPPYPADHQDGMPVAAAIHRPASTIGMFPHRGPLQHAPIQRPATTVAFSPPGPSSQQRRQSAEQIVRNTSVSPISEVSPIQSGSETFSPTQMQTPSPLSTIRRSSTGLTQSLDRVATFTPSPDSQTHGSMSQASKPSGLRHSISNPSGEMTIEGARVVASPPPIPDKTPIVPDKVPAEEESYFPPQPPSVKRGSDAGPSEQSRTIPLPSVNPQPAHSDSTQSGTLHSAKVLHSIEERGEGRHLMQGEPSRTKRHTIAGSAQESTPEPPNVSEPVGTLVQPQVVKQQPAPVSAQSVLPQGQQANPPDTQSQQGQQQVQAPAGQTLSHNRVHSQGNIPPAPQTPHPQHHQPTHGQTHLTGYMQPPIHAPLAGQVPQNPPPWPGQVVHPQQHWAPQAPRPMSQVFPPPPQGPAVKEKEKEKKWSRWFKGSSKLSKAVPVERQSIVPLPRQSMPPPQSGFQGHPGQQPPPGQVPYYNGQPMVWYPSSGQPPMGQPPPPGPQKPGMPHQHTEQRMNGSPHGSVTSLQKTPTTGSVSTVSDKAPGLEHSEGQPQQSPPRQQQPTSTSQQSPQRQPTVRQHSALRSNPPTASFAPPAPPAPQTAPAPQVQILPQQVSQQQQSQQYHQPPLQYSQQPYQQHCPPPQHPPQHPVQYSPPPNNHYMPFPGPPPAFVQHQPGNGSPSSNPMSPTLVPAPLFAKPNTPQGNTHGAMPSAQVVSGQSQHTQGPPQRAITTKWLKRPAADYSGGGWGDDESA